MQVYMHIYEIICAKKFTIQACHCEYSYPAGGYQTERPKACGTSEAITHLLCLYREGRTIIIQDLHLK